MKVGGKKAISCSFLDPPEKPSPCFLTTPQKKENPYLTLQLQLYQFNVFCTSSEKNCTKGKNCTTTDI